MSNGIYRGTLEQNRAAFQRDEEQRARNKAFDARIRASLPGEYLPREDEDR